MTRVVNLPGYRTIVVQSCIASILSASSDTPASLTMRLSVRGPSPKQLEHFHCCYCRNAFSLGLPSGAASAVAAGLMYEGLRKVTIIAIVGLYADKLRLFGLIRCVLCSRSREFERTLVTTLE